MMSDRGSKIFAAFALCALSALGSPARASDDDTQLWLYFNTAVPLAPNVGATFELSPRLREGGDQFLARGIVDFKLSPGVSVGGGLAYVANHGAAEELRPIQQLTLTAGKLAFRTRVEERFFDGADRMQLRLRERIQLTQPLARDTKLTAAGELLYIARTENRASEPRVDSWRFALAAQHRFGKRIEGGLGYLLIYSPRDGKPDRVSHVPQITLTARL
jgi:hypothetical protein